MSTKTGVCKCGQTVTIPKYQCIFECHACSNLSIFLCHIIPQPHALQNLQCRLCDQNYLLYTCPKCQASSVIKNFRSGYIYNCLCGFQSNMISCRTCTTLLLLPTRKIYQQTKINCKKCNDSFKYILCKSCKECIYYNKDQDAKDIDYCQNSKCRRYPQNRQNFNVEENRQISKSQKLPMKPKIQELTNNMVYSNPYVTIKEQSKEKKQGFIPEINEADLCNICSFNQKCMINTTCFHLSVCEQCSKKINNKCPICNQLGSYNKVYKT